MSSPVTAGIITTKISQSDQIQSVTDANARDSYESTKLEEPDSSAAIEVLWNNNPDMALSSLGEVAAPLAYVGAQVRKLEGQLKNSAGFKSQSDTGILLVDEGEDDRDISQTHARAGQDLALWQDDLELTRKVFDDPHREADSKSMQLHAKLQSALRRMMELERHLGAMRNNRFIRRERIQLGLEVSVAGKCGISASGFPFIMILALIVVIIPGAYKYYTFSA